MKATQQLSSEHQAVKLMLQILQEIAQRLKSQEKIDPSHLNHLVEFIQVFVDGCHHAKEEELLFPALKQAGMSSGGGLVGLMVTEHARERALVRDLIAGINEYKKGNPTAAGKIVEDIRKIDILLSAHINKEDELLYPQADQHLTEEEQNRLFAEFEKIENERVGAGRHEQFHQLLDELKKIYLEQ